MTIKLRCNDYGYECDLVLDEELTVGLIEKLRDHFVDTVGFAFADASAASASEDGSYNPLPSVIVRPESPV